MNDDQDDYEVTLSPLSRTVEQNGHKVSIEIYQDEEDGWILEIVDEENNSTVWDDVFDSDQEALDEALDTIREEGIECLVASVGWGEK
ncbi:hypothetical protein [Marinimicrobium sp. ABcell2]|uniref:hypothetical protein n=1 Tax=Marinimicrobium sp. ABcell2 TaxID=3069751 RepID=UPI0027B1B9DE|nr:hypothetical protein [Marinimicrobium sp. ABcell2]MDQ2076625.1 hypothetical protein [Marinimicrobium sp. ABcell2]